MRLPDGRYFHLTAQGTPAYTERYRYAGDYRDGIAVVQREDGKHTHIDCSGSLVHGRWFLDLDVFHKNHARACDTQGWHHVDMDGEPLSAARFRNVEPFYNGQARVERFDGALSVIDESGSVLLELRKPQRSQLEELSADMVGLWKTGTIHAAVQLGVFEALPASGRDIEASLQLGKDTGFGCCGPLPSWGWSNRTETGGTTLPPQAPISVGLTRCPWPMPRCTGAARFTLPGATPPGH